MKLCGFLMTLSHGGQDRIVAPTLQSYLGSELGVKTQLPGVALVSSVAEASLIGEAFNLRERLVSSGNKRESEDFSLIGLRGITPERVGRKIIDYHKMYGWNHTGGTDNVFEFESLVNGNRAVNVIYVFDDALVSVLDFGHPF